MKARYIDKECTNLTLEKKLKEIYSKTSFETSKDVVELKEKLVKIMKYYKDGEIGCLDVGEYFCNHIGQDMIKAINMLTEIKKNK